MTLTLVQRNPEDAAPARRAEFRAPGGTLGRDPANHLVLPDATGKLCRVQAALRIDPYACRLRNLSTMSAVTINDVPLAAGQELSIAPGDTLRIGSYVLDVEIAQAAGHADQTRANATPAPMDTPAGPSAPEKVAPVAVAPVAVAPVAVAPTTVAPAAGAPATAAPVAAAVATASVAAVPTTAAATDVVPVADTPADTTPASIAPVAETARAMQATVETAAARLPDVSPPAAAAPNATMAPVAPRDLPELPDLSEFESLPPIQADGTDDPLAASHTLAPEPQAPVDEDVFSGLFGPGTLPVGTISDVSAHPFEMESSQARNASDPLAHLPHGDASVSRPQRDPLALFEAPHGGQDVFADETPSTLPSHDPLTPMRSDPVRDTLQRPRAPDGRMSARDHASISGSFLRPAAPRTPSRNGGEREDNKR